MCSSYDIRKLLNAVPLHGGRQVLYDFPAGAGLHQIGSSHAHGGGPGQHQLQHVLGGADAAHAYDGDVHGLIDLIHHPHRQRKDAGAGHSAGAVGQQGTAALQVDPHPRQSIDKADTVGPGLLTGPCHGSDIRRSRGERKAGVLSCGAIQVDTGARRCTATGQEVKLSPREYELLLCLLRNQGQVLSRAQLLDKVWGLDFEGDDRAVDVRVRSLRAALGKAGKQIKTVFKAGYRLEEG